MTDKNDKKSVIMLISAMLIFGTVGIFRKWIPMSSALLAFARGLQGTIFLLFFVKVTGKKVFYEIKKKTLGVLLLSGAMIGVNWILLFEAYNYTTVPTATLCYYMEPTIVILLSPVFLKEKLTGKKMICSAVAILGMILVSGIIDGNRSGSNDFKGILFGLGAAALYSAVVLLNKKLGKIDAYQKTIFQLGAASLAIVPYLIVTENLAELSWTPANILILLILGIVHTGIAYTLYFGSMDGLKAQSIAIFSYIDPISALILAALLLGEALTPAGMIGAVLILGATIVSEL